jgi:ribose transport system substrate-binding protein
MRHKKYLLTVLISLLLISQHPPKPLAAQVKPHHIAFVPTAFTSPFHVLIAEGARAEAAAKGWRIDVQAPASENDFAGQLTIVQALLETGVDAISVNPINVDVMTSAIKTANDSGVPFFFHNLITPVSDPDVKVASYIGYDQWRGAKLLGQYSCKLIAQKYGNTIDKTSGKVYILEGIESLFTHRRTQGFLDGLKDCPGVRVVGQQTAEWLRDKGTTVAAAALQKDPDIDVFYSNSDEMGIGAALAAERLGLTINKDFFVVSIDGNQPTLDLIQQGKYTATLGVDPKRMGKTVIDAMDDVLNGQVVPQYLITPAVVVDATNIDDYIAGRTWTMPVAGVAELDNGKPSDSATLSTGVAPN